MVEVSELPSAGQSLVARGVRSVVGGKASNIAMGVARLGGSAHLVTCLGTDHWADEALALWRKAGIDLRGVVRCASAGTGLGIVCVSAEGENFTVSALGANRCLSPVDIDAAMQLFREVRVCTVHLNAPFETLERALGLARTAGAITVLNASPVEDVHDGLYRLADVVVVNAVEAADLTGRKIGGFSDAVSAATALRERGCGAVVVTLGACGAIGIGDGGTFASAYGASRIRDTTGAGDAFVAALSVELSRGESLQAALDFATASGALSVQTRGTWESMPARADVESLRSSAAARIDR